MKGMFYGLRGVPMKYVIPFYESSGKTPVQTVIIKMYERDVLWLPLLYESRGKKLLLYNKLMERDVLLSSYIVVEVIMYSKYDLIWNK